MFSFTNLTRGCREYTVTARPSDVASLVTSTFHICFVRSFKNEPERTLFSCFIFCRTTSLLAVAILSGLYSTTLLVTLIAKKVTGDKSTKKFRGKVLVLLVTFRSLTSQLVSCDTWSFSGLKYRNCSTPWLPGLGVPPLVLSHSSTGLR